MNQIKIAIVDDQNLFRQSLGLLIESIPEFELVQKPQMALPFRNFATATAIA